MFYLYLFNGSFEKGRMFSSENNHLLSLAKSYWLRLFWFMALTISELLENIKYAGEKIFNANGYEFQRGFNTCYYFFEQELNKTDLFSQSHWLQQIRLLEALIDKRSWEIEKTHQVSSFAILAVQNESISTVSKVEQENELLKKEIAELKGELNNRNQIIANNERRIDFLAKKIKDEQRQVLIAKAGKQVKKYKK